LYWGPENANAANGRRRFLLTNVVGFQATEQLALKAEMNVGTQRRISTVVAGTEGFDNAQWWGLALYGRYALTEKFGMAYRFELFRDINRTRTAVAGATPTATLWAQTITADYQIYENLLGRVEFRFDKSHDTEAFGVDSSSQSTLGAQLIYSFA
jgi:hypothetical protein